MTSASTIKARSSNILNTDEYRDPQDGLIHCAVCGEPKEIKKHLLGREYAPRIKCKCEREKDIAYEMQCRKKDRIATAMRWKAAALQDKEMQSSKFADDLGYNTAKVAYAKQYVDMWEDMYSTGRGLLLSGEQGTGKTFLACCIGNALIDDGIPVLMTNVTKIVDTYGEVPLADKASMMESIRNYDLLIIDDLGAERSTEYAKEILYKVINGWYCTGKPLIVTTNLPVKSLRETVDESLSRIYSRVLERCVPVLVNTTDVRKSLADKNKARLKSVLSGTGSSDYHS